MKIGQRMKERRLKLGLRVKDLSSQLKVAESTYRDWENGRAIQGEPYLKIANALSISIGYLLGLETQVNDSKIIEQLEAIEKSIKIIRKNVNQTF